MKVHDVVVLKEDLPEEGLTKGMHGVILLIFDHPSLAYEVEFCDDQGRTIAELALSPAQIEAVAPARTGR